jgi:2-polyprenyl-6-methoxyphenol hydroxylase-like FAD-dependent oxidoreductase
MTEKIGCRAVVLGGSIAGLLAARVLADRYEEVTVVDRDTLPVDAAERRGVPQGRHAHALLARGQQVLEELFPGFTAELAARGAPIGDVLGDVRMHLSGHRLRQTHTGLIAVSVSRALLESGVRARVRALPGVVFIERCDAVGLTSTPDARRITGARVLRRADGSTEEILRADLVVDATGRGSRAPIWLEAHGYQRPPEERMPIDLGYATCTYRLPPDALGGDLASLVAPTPAHPRGGVLARLEGNRWMLTLAGVLGDHPPVDPEGFLDYARSLQFRDIYDSVVDAGPLDHPIAFRFPRSMRRRYEQLARFPAGFLLIGDSLCSLNPIYGQGMSVAALQALTLGRHLGRHTTPPAHQLVRDIARVADAPWLMVVGGDLAFPGVDGHRSRVLRLTGAYIARLHAGAAHDATLARAFARVSGLVDPPEALLRPTVTLRVLRETMRRPAAAPTPADGIRSPSP